MTYFKKIFSYAGPFKLYIGLNIFFNIFYALFSAISFVAMIPMLNVLFDETPKIDQVPTYKGLSSTKEYLSDWMNFHVSKAVEEDPHQALMLSIGLILTLFFLKNLFNYLALFFITFCAMASCEICVMICLKKWLNYLSLSTVKRKRRYHCSHYRRCFRNSAFIFVHPGSTHKRTVDYSIYASLDV